MNFTPDETTENPALYSPLTLAFVGDGVYELYVRTRVMQGGNAPAYLLHKKAVHFVKAASQAKSYRAMESALTENEMTVFKRGRNAKSPSVPKNADVVEYRCATGFEALLGYLYLKGESERLDELMNIAYNAVEE